MTEAVARHGSVGAAAKELLTTQPSASRRLSALERRLRTRHRPPPRDPGPGPPAGSPLVGPCRRPAAALPGTWPGHVLPAHPAAAARRLDPVAAGHRRAGPRRRTCRTGHGRARVRPLPGEHPYGRMAA
ncbi:LysR family transcriptional regulator [Streptomyces tendae]|uniref:helix-turn-helix domain-containing protein n=1 Tax=Streptomyces tendae TaxID=1932 RepID=UPI0036BFB893